MPAVRSRRPVTPTLSARCSGWTARCGPDGPERAVRAVRGFAVVARVLVVDDDPVTVVGLELQLRALGHEVRSRPTLAAGLLAAVEERADVLLLDLDLGDGHTGDELLALLDRGVGRPVVTCLLSGSDADELAALADRLGATWLPKPVSPRDLAQVLGRAPRGPAGHSGRGG